MLRYALLAGGMLLASPVLAQTQAKHAPPPKTAPADRSAAPADPAQTAPATPAADPATPPAQDPAATPNAMTAQADPAKPMDSTAPAPTQQAAQSAAEPAAGEPAASGQQVAQIVNSEFASYDKDKNGTLNEAEFDAWMVALKTASDPSTKPDAPATKTWMRQAFAQADTDKNKTISKTELTGFLSAGRG